MKRYLVSDAELKIVMGVPQRLRQKLVPLPSNARMLTLEAILSANAKHGGGTPTVGLMRALEELFGEDDK